MKLIELKDSIIMGIRQGEIRPDDNEQFIRLVRQEDEDVRREMAQTILCEEGDNLRMNVWLYSFSIALYPEPNVLKSLIMLVQMSSVFNYKEKYFIFQQINSILFKNPGCNTEDMNRMAWGLLEQIKRECMRDLKLNLRRFPVSSLNTGISVVLVEQYLTEEHGPTKTALDRCYALKKIFGQDVMLINTAELLTLANPVYFEAADIGNYIDALSGRDQVMWQGETFRFYQCARTMPCDEGILDLVSFIEAIRPSSIVLVGGTSLVAGILNEMIPVITVGTTQSGLAITLSEYQIINQNMLEKGYSLLERMGRSKEHIIPGRFTFSLKTQTQHTTREKLGIDVDAFSLAVVGGRLTEEVTDDFLSMLEGCVCKLQDDKKIQIGIIGGCADFDEKLARHEKLRGKLINVGFVSDILSVVEHFDLYVNPTRRGGGTSVVEAMSKGLPAVTVDYGDVAGIVGPAFCCADYKEMQEEIIRYTGDAAYYESKSAFAKQIAADYLDSVKEFGRIMQVYYRKLGFITDTEPILTVVVPCYNVERYVERCIDSIISQTIGLDKLEVLLINDASTDDTLSIIKRYEAQYPEQIRVIDLPQNSGLSHARNVGIQEAKTEYIAFVDSDDWLSPEMYEDLYRNGIAKGCDLAICGYDRPGKSEQAVTGAEKQIILEDMDASLRTLLLREYRMDVYAWNKIYKKTLFTEYDIWYPEGLYYEDNYVGFLMLLICKKPYITDAPFYHWVVNASGITGTAKKIFDRFEVQNHLLEKIRQMKLYDQFRDEIAFNYYEKAFVECLVLSMQTGVYDIDKLYEIKEYVLSQVSDIERNQYYIGQEDIAQLLITRNYQGLLKEFETKEAMAEFLNQHGKH